MDIGEARAAIDGLDNEILQLFLRRMELCRDIAAEKGKAELSIRDEAREEEILRRVRDSSGELSPYAEQLFKELMAQSRSYQRGLLNSTGGYALIGEHLPHSLSPRIHAMLGISDYSLLELQERELERLIRSGAYKGFNVTMPYKKKVIAFCDSISEKAREIGCVNTIVRAGDGSIRGDNTDADGLEYAIKRAKIELSGKRVLILGGGGASLTAQYVAREHNAARISVVTRCGDNTYADLPRLSDSEIIINATPVGMYPDCGASALELSLFPQCSGVIDLVYNPLRTRLISDAARRGIACTGGLSMLVYQAKRAQELFLDCNIPDTAAERVINELYGESQNIVLCGMPGSGKSSIARELAALSGKKLVSIDDEILRQTGLTPRQLIGSYGEVRFRELESEAINRFGAQLGQIIDLGGGAVTVPQNLPPLKQNGRVYHIERKLSQLATEGRPLSADLEKLFVVRAPMYAAFADASVKNDGSAADAAQRIMEDFRENSCY